MRKKLSIKRAGTGALTAAVALLAGTASYGAISLYGDGDGYDSNNKDWQSNTADDIDGNGLGTDGYIFFGDFVAESANVSWGADPDITAISSNLVTDVLPSYVTAASMGADATTKIGNYPGYEALDNPLIGDGTDGVCGNIVISGDKALDFTVSGLSAGATIRVGVVTVLNDDIRARFDAPVISLTDGSDTVSVTNLPNLSGSDNTDGPGWVFFDVDSDGDYTVLIPNGSATDDGADKATAVNGLGGVTFDSFPQGTGATLDFAPGTLSLVLRDPDTSTNGTITASYKSGVSSSADIEILSSAADAGFTPSIVNTTLGLANTDEDITVIFDNAGVGLADGESTNSTLVLTWSEVGSSVINTSNVPLDVTYTDPVNLYVEAVVPMPDTWNLWDPEANSSLSAESSSGFTATFAQVQTAEALGYRPVVAQEFSAVRDLSLVGQSVTVSFDLVLLNNPVNNGNAFRMAFYDTGLNASWFWGIDLGTAGGTISRIHNAISAQDQTQFLSGDYGLLGLGYHSSFPGASVGKPDNGLNAAGVTNHIEMTLSRIETNEVAFSGVWADAGSNTGTYYYVIDETAPLYPAYMPPGGKWNSVDGFGLMIFKEQPFAPASSGSLMVSNFEVTSLTQLPADWGYSVSDIAIESSGDITLTLSDPIVGATYNVIGTSDLVHVVPGAVGTYVAVEPGVIIVPAADAGLNTFFDVALPVIEVIE